MATIKTDFGAGGVGLQPEHGSPSLATALRDVADDISDLAGGLVAWTDALTVTTHQVTLGRAGVPIAVEATTADSAGVKAVQYSASPAQGYVRAEFSAGVATLTFNATDNVTVARALLSPAPATVRTLKG